MKEDIPKLWQEEARRIGGTHLVDTIEQMGKDIHDIKKSVADLTDNAFPNGDIAGHREYHRLIIKKTEEIRQLRIAVQTKTISGLVWALIVFLGLCVFKTVAGWFVKGGM